MGILPPTIHSITSVNSSSQHQIWWKQNTVMGMPSIHIFTILLTIVALLLNSFHSYPFGAPACVSSPRHGMEPRTDRNELGVVLTKQVTREGVILLHLEAEAEENCFKGLLVTT